MSGQAPGTLYKVAMVAASPFPYPQGSQVLIGQLAAALHRRGHQVRLIAYQCGLGQSPAGVQLQRIRAIPGLTTTQAGPSWRKPLLDMLLAKELLQVARRWQPDVVHTHNFEGLLAALFVRRLTGVPVVHHIHNAMGLELHTYFGSRPGRWLGDVVGHWVDARLLRWADYCIVLQEAAVSYFRQWDVARLQVIPPGIDFEPGDAARARARLRLGIRPLILYSGNLDRYQDLGLLLRAFERVAAARSDACLVISTNADPDKWQAQVEMMGLDRQIVFVQTDDFGAVRDLLAAADVAVCPRTVCLGFPIKLLNYMSAGKAIVASAGSACGLHHLENGWVVDDSDIEGIAQAIVALLEDRELACRLGERARQTAKTEYTWEQSAVAIEAIYEQVGQAPAAHKRRQD